jgi:AraC family transcriptional regulator of adaptative response / DNA-3-methyladenine glycosylase II
MVKQRHGQVRKQPDKRSPAPYNRTMEALEPKVCYRALRTRDARFDGRFFTGVVSTGVFCRPVCPAPTPKLENCRFYVCAAAAQEAGFRPCLRCRPETSPGSAPWVGTCVTVSRALRLIADGALDHGSVETLAERVGVGDRHLRRLFLRHLGTSPQRVAQTRRLLFAKKLIDETDLSMTQVAHASGFSSVRRFNDAIRATYQRPPSHLRRAGPSARSDIPKCRRTAVARNDSEISLRLGFRPPYDWPALRDFMAARETRRLEEVGHDFYRRSIRIGDDHGLVEVRTAPNENYMQARIRVANPARLATLVERLRRLFDLDADPSDAIRSKRRYEPFWGSR